MFLTALCLSWAAPARAVEPTCRGLFINHQAEYAKRYEDYEAHWDAQRNTGKFALSAVQQDESQGARKLNIYRALGYRVSEDGLQAPTFKVFVEKYIRLMDRKKIPAKDRLLPAILMVRTYVSKPNEYRWITPGLDPWPTEGDFRFYNSAGYDAFNISNELFSKALEEGKFPLLSDTHDPEHLVGFAMHPSYMRAIRRALSAKGSRGPSFENRMYFAMELLSLANPRATERLRAILKTPVADSFVDRRVFETQFAALPEAELFAQARTLIDSYDSLMVDYGGAVVRSSEKQMILGNPLIYKLRRKETAPRPRTVIEHLANSPLKNDQPYEREHQAMFSFALAPRVNLSLLLTSLETVERTQRKTAILNFFGIGERGSREKIITLLRSELARAEFILWNTSRTPASMWARELLVPRMRSTDSVPVQIMREAFGADSYAYRLMTAEAAP